MPPFSKHFSLAIIGSALTLTSCAIPSFAEPMKWQSRGIARSGYIYGFPAVLMSETMKAATNPRYLCDLGAPANSFMHKFDTPDASFRAVVRPNVDTLYSSAFLDLSETAMVLEVPEIRDRFYLMAILDAWTNNFAGPGTQTNNGEATAYLIVGPDWEGELPEGMELIQSPTNTAWIIGRTQLKGPDDFEAANSIQRAYQLYPHGGAPIKPDTSDCFDAADRSAPEDIVREMSGVEFFAELNRIIADNPPPASNEDKLKDLAKIGVGPFKETSIADLSDSGKAALDEGMKKGQKAMDMAFGLATRFLTWSPNPEKVPLGDYGTDYLVRGIVSQIGFGANRNEFAVYQNTGVDGGRNTLNGSKHTYSITFGEGELPPVNAFWSLTVYDKNGFLFDNASQKYAVGSYSNLQTNENGETVIIFAPEKPAAVPAENWLPTPEGPFEVTIRMYWPETKILDRSWKTPPLKQVD